MKKSRAKKIVILCLLALLGILWAFSLIVYHYYCNQRFESYEPTMFHVSDFDGLECEELRFASNKGQMLTGYLYNVGNEQRGVVVMAHGYGGGGHNSYMDAANYFAQHGYFVFAYDATGNDKSEGDAVGGLPQGVIDLDHAISFVKSHERLKGLPLVLFGHSWGGYCVGSVLAFQTEVKAVIEVSGFNRASDLFEYQGEQIAGKVIRLMMPFVKLHERIKYGEYASVTAIDGFEKSSAAIMAVHSLDDEIVPASYGFSLYFDKYKDDPRFTFVPFEDRGHDDVLNDSGNTYKDEFNEEFYKWRDALSYDYTAEENGERYQSDRADYIRSNIDRAKWSSRLDEVLFERFLSFYDENISKTR